MSEHKIYQGVDLTEMFGDGKEPTDEQLEKAEKSLHEHWAELLKGTVNMTDLSMTNKEVSK